MRPGHEDVLVLVEREALYHRVTAEFRAQPIDGMFGFGGAAVDQIRQIVARDILQMADADADQAIAGGADFVAE